MGEVFELLKNLPFGGIGFAGLVTLAIVGIFRGDIVPRTTMESMRTTYDRVIATKDDECETYKEAYRMSEKARSTSAEADKELLELGRTTVHLLESIHDRAHGKEGV